MWDLPCVKPTCQICNIVSWDTGSKGSPWRMVTWGGFVFDTLFSPSFPLVAQAPSNYPQLLRALNYKVI